jgi:hypothetical protein
MGLEITELGKEGRLTCSHHPSVFLSIDSRISTKGCRQP